MTLALVTGASSGIGLELARICIGDGHEVVAVANEPAIYETGLPVQGVEADIGTTEGITAVMNALNGRVPDLLFLNAGTGVRGAFAEQEISAIERVVAVNVLGALRLLHPIVRGMVTRGSGRILITGSIAGYMPGAWQAIYSATKAFLNSIAGAVAEEVDGTGVTVTCLAPGAVETRFFERADLLDTPAGRMPKDDPAMVAQAGYRSMMAGDRQITPGLKNKAMGAAAEVAPAEIVARASTKMFRPDGQR